MKFLAAIIIIAVIALVGSRVTFLNRRLPLGLRNILFTGTEYIFIGMLLGEFGFRILDTETLVELDSILLFGLAWIGFLFGLQFEIRLLKNLPKYYFSITAIQSTITFIVVGLSIYPILSAFLDLPKGVIILSSITLGATASCTAQSAIAIVNQNYRIQNRGLLDLMRYISSVDGVFALLFFSLALVFFPNSLSSEGVGILESLQWILIAIVIGAFPGIVLIIFGRSRFSNQEFTLFLVGTILFCGGMAQQLSFSPLISGMICGVVVANFCRHRVRAIQIVVHAEKSIYILLLLIVGALWQFKLDISLLIGVFYFLIRILGKVVGVYTATHIYKPIYKVPWKLGLGLISEGGLVIAIILNFRFLYPPAADSMITIVVFSVFASELISPRLILGQFKKDDVSLKKQTSVI